MLLEKWLAWQGEWLHCKGSRIPYQNEKREVHSLVSIVAAPPPPPMISKKKKKLDESWVQGQPLRSGVGEGEGGQQSRSEAEELVGLTLKSCETTFHQEVTLVVGVGGAFSQTLTEVKAPSTFHAAL